ncbi:MAG TPA: SusC/RagA family TonB-linked outer membrane protein [Bacteroidales bacterium]|nr:SusC/RagA family TonB-linked outer membrane protein [Bacteroidales bacterium]
MRKIFTFFVCVCICGISAIHAQDVQIRGTVTAAEDGSPLPGVYVKIKGTNSGTVTDANGTYQVSAPSNGTLVFSFIGYESKEVEIAGQTVIDVALSSGVTQMSEVVVTALGITREKKSLGYATQEVSGDAVNTIKTDNFINSLSGKIAGVNVKTNNNMGGSTNIVIRGAKSLTGNNQALFVVDGVPVDNANTNNAGQLEGRSGYDYGNTASDINPNDIESISVLKGAAASALYGARAANGVVMITTKKGAKQAAKGFGVNLNSNVTFSKIDKSTLPDYQNQYGGGYGPFYSDGEHPGLEIYDSDGDGVDDLNVPFYEDASYGEKFDPSLQVFQWDAFVPESPNYLKKTPWVPSKHGPDEFFETGVTWTNTLEITGGAEKSAFRLSYTNYDQKAIMPNGYLRKNNLTFNGSHDVLKNLTVSASANYTNTKGKGRNSTGYSDNIMTSFRQWYQVNTDIKLLEDLYHKTGRNISWNRTYSDDPYPLYWDSPYWVRYKNYETDERNRLLGYVQTDWKALPWLSFMGRAAVDTYNELQEERKAIGSVAGELGVGRPDVTSGYSRLSRTHLGLNLDLLANFRKDITEKLNLNGMVGVNFNKRTTDQVFESTNGGLSVSDVYSLGNSLDPMLPPEESNAIIALNGYYASVSLGFANTLFLDGTYRIDQSSTLPKENWTYTYPSVTLSFLFSEILKANWLQLGKVRLNYAEVGSDAPYASINDIYTQITPFNRNSMVSVSSIKNNPNLKPERTKSIEGGLELSMFQSRVGLDLALYKQNTVDQILPITLSRATGRSFKYVNAGEIENKGIEVQLNLVPVKVNDFSWTLSLMWSRNKNQVKDLAPGIENLELGSLQGGVSINARKGEPYGAIQGTDFQYVNGQRLVRASGYYRRTTSSDIVIGNINPDWNGGISNALAFRGLKLSFLIDIQKGGDIFSLDQWYGQATGIYKESVRKNDLGNPIRNHVYTVYGDPTTPMLENPGGIIFPGVFEDGTPNNVRVEGADYRAFGYVYWPNSAYIYDASYVKLREVVLTYALPPRILGKSFISGASINFIGSNLWIIHKNLPYSDPEAGQSSGNLQGWQSGALPSTRNFGVGINVQF